MLWVSIAFWGRRPTGSGASGRVLGLAPWGPVWQVDSSAPERACFHLPQLAGAIWAEQWRRDRGHRAEQREVLPDPTFGDQMVTKFMNVLMVDGKKSAAEKIVYGAFDRISGRTGQEGVQVFHEALENVRPQVEVRSRAVHDRPNQ